MTNKEYKERRQTLGLAQTYRRVICGCFIAPFDGSIQYRYHPLRKNGIPVKQ